MVFDEERGRWIRFRIEAPTGAVLTNASPDLEPTELEDTSDRDLKKLILSLCGR